MGAKRTINRGDKRISNRDIFTNRVLEILCFGGALTKETVEIMHGKKHAKENSLTTMRKKNWIKTKNKITTLWYASEYKKEWGARLPEGYGEMGERETALGNRDSASKYRMVQLGRLLSIMQEADIPLLPTKDEQKTDNNISYFTPSRYIKRLNSGDNKALSGSKAQGVITVGKKGYILFISEGDAIMVESSRENIFTETYKNYYDLNRLSTIVYLGSMEHPEKFFPTKKIKRGQRVANMDYLQYTTSMQELLLIPDTYEGAVITKMMLQPNIKEKLGNLIKKKEEDETPIDYWEPSGVAHINYLIPNIGHLYRSHLYLKHNKVESLVVHCISGYEAGIKEVFPEAKVEVYTLQELIQKLH